MTKYLIIQSKNYEDIESYFIQIEPDEIDLQDVKIVEVSSDYLILSIDKDKEEDIRDIASSICYLLIAVGLSSFSFNLNQQQDDLI